MIRPIKDKRREKAAKKNMPKPQPEWAEAFMIFLLAKAGGSASLSLEKLKAFSKIKGGKATELSYDAETKKVTLSLHEKVKGKKPVIMLPDKRMII